MFGSEERLRALMAARSAAWAARAESGRKLALRYADDESLREVLVNLLLDNHDSAVTVAAAGALLEREDLVGLRLFAKGVALADDEQLDHLHDAIIVKVFIPDLQSRFVELAKQPGLQHVDHGVAHGILRVSR